MIFSLFVNGSPTTSIDRSHAFQTAKAVLASGHELYRVFFYAEGVLHAIEDLNSAKETWQTLAAGTATDLCFCSGSVKTYDVLFSSKHANVSIGGLVQLLDAQLHSDRVVSIN
ncbi:MAG: DsrE/DsrF/TusD sulfur relay family protein [Pseudomonadales bacterium]